MWEEGGMRQSKISQDILGMEDIGKPRKVPAKFQILHLIVY